MSMKKKTDAFYETGIADDSIGDVVVSLAGHDAGFVLIVVGKFDENNVLVADGKTRKISSPKKKKVKHISVISRLGYDVRMKILDGTANDSLLRREIASVTAEKLN